MSNMDYRYIVVKLKDGTEFDFDKKCNSVCYGDDYYCIFKHEYGHFGSTSYIMLGLIPHDNVLYILTKER